MEKITSVRFPATTEKIEEIENPSIILLQEVLKRFPVEHDVLSVDEEGKKRMELRQVNPEDLELAYFAHPNLSFPVICVGYPERIGDGVVEVEESLYIPESKGMRLTVSGQAPVNVEISLDRGELERMTITKSVFNLEGREVTIKGDYFRNCKISIIRSGEIKKSAFREDRINALIVFTDGMALKIETGEEIKRVGVLFL